MVRLIAMIVALAAPVDAGAALHKGLRGPGHLARGPAGQPFTPYVARLVYLPPFATFGTASGVSLGANGGVDTSHVVMSFLFRATWGTTYSAETNTMATQAGWSAYLVDLVSNMCSSAATSSESCPGFDLVSDNAGSSHPTLRLNLSAADSTEASIHSEQRSYFGRLPPLNGNIHQLLIVADTGFSGVACSGPGRRVALVLDGVTVSPDGRQTVGACAAMNVAINQSTGGGGGGGWRATSQDNATLHKGAFGLGEFFLDTASTTAAGCSAFGDAANHLIDATEAVCPALIAAFWDSAHGTPVDTGATCAGPTGRADVCLKGDASAFFTNRGSAIGSMALMKTDPANGQDAAAGFDDPCDTSGCPADSPYPEWSVGARSTSVAAGSTGFTGDGVPTNMGYGVVAGHFMTLQVGLTEGASASVDRAIDCRTNGVAGSWTGIVNKKVVGASGQYWAVFYRVAVAGVDDVAVGGGTVSAGKDMANPPVCTWTNGNGGSGVAVRSVGYQLTSWANVNAATPVQAQGTELWRSGNGNTLNPVSAPSITTQPATVASFSMTFDNSTAITTPTGYRRSWNEPAVTGGSKVQLALDWKSYAATGSIGTDADHSLVGGANSGGTIAVVLQH